MGLYNVKVGGAVDVVHDFADGQLPNGWVISGATFEVSTQGLHTSNYPNDYTQDDGSYIIMVGASPDSTFEFTIPSYSLGSATAGGPDVIEIRDGGSASAPLIKTLSGSSVFETNIVTTSNKCYIYYIEGYLSTSARGFFIPEVIERSTNTSCTLEQTGEDGIAVSLPYKRNEPVSEVNNFVMELKLANISLPTSTADTLKTNHKFDVGYKFIIVLDDNSIVTMDATTASSGTQPYQVDTSSVTNGEIPSRVFLAEEKLAVNYNYIPHIDTVYGTIDPDSGKLACTKKFGSLNIVATDLITKIDFHSIGNEMISLKYDMIKD